MSEKRLLQGSGAIQRKRQIDISNRLHNGTAASVVPTYSGKMVEPTLSLSAIGILKSKLHRRRSNSIGNLPRITDRLEAVKTNCHTPGSPIKGDTMELGEEPNHDHTSRIVPGPQTKIQPLYYASEEERDKGYLMLSSPKVFWRHHLHVSIDIHYHPGNSLFEVIAYDVENHLELSRLYAKATDIYSANEKYFEQHYKQVRQEHILRGYNQTIEVYLALTSSLPGPHFTSLHFLLSW